MKDKDNKLSKCPLCVHGEIKVINITTNPSPDIDDAYDIQCTHCNSTWCVAVKKGATVENVWNALVARWEGRFSKTKV